MPRPADRVKAEGADETGEAEAQQDAPKTGQPHVKKVKNRAKLIACWLAGLLACWLAGLLACWLKAV